MPNASQIAWIGTGVMGASMAGHLLHAGHKLTVHTRTKSKAQPLLDNGAQWADTPAQAAENCDVAISIVAYPEDVERVHLAPDGTLAASNPPKLIIDMTTSRPSLAVKIAGIAKKIDIGSLDAPVSGGDVGARNATLSIMVGGEKEQFDAAAPLFRLMGKHIVHHGPPGSGQHAKMVNQILVAASMVGVSEGLLYTKKIGLNPNKVIESVSSGAAGSWTVSNLAPRMINRDFHPGFYVEHFVKDLRIAVEECERMNLNLPGLQLAKRLYEQLESHGHARLGTQALLLELERNDSLG